MMKWVKGHTCVCQGVRLCYRNSISYCVPLDLSECPTVCCVCVWKMILNMLEIPLCVCQTTGEISTTAFLLSAERHKGAFSTNLLFMMSSYSCHNWRLLSKWMRKNYWFVCVCMRAESSVLPSNANALWESLRENEKHTWMGKQEILRDSFAECRTPHC